MESPFLVTRADGVVTITINRPARKNAITPDGWTELRRIFDEVAAATEDRVLVITGASGDFCSGADLAELGSGSAVAALVGMRRTGDCALALYRLPKPTIAKVRGVAVGAGCNLALACDLVLASDGARFSEIFAKRGLSLDFGGSWLLPRLVGLHQAKELALLADMVTATEALTMGLINRAVPDSELDGVVDELAARLAAGPPLALSMTKTLLNNSAAVSFEQAVEDEARAQAVNFASADTAEAMAAFLTRREPRFEGR
jgi:2-(1,2-epoxy-1,2-dihydrophenyl)acetyl-CoA isomerase